MNAILAPVAADPGFADQVRGTGPRAIDLTMARMMDDLYDDHYGRDRVRDVDGWTQVTDAALLQAGIDPATLSSDESGFRALIYGDGKGHYAIAYSGTDEGKDWLTNLRQGIGLEDAQYNQAVALAQEAVVAFGKDNVIVTGHSLGGGLAATAALVADVPGVTFNASGVHGKTVERFGLDRHAARDYAQEGLIRRYAVNNEILTDLQEESIPLKWAMPDAMGAKILLSDPDPQTFWQKVNPVADLRHDIRNHYIDAVLLSLQQYLDDEGVTGGNAIGALKKDGDSLLLSDASHPQHSQFQRALKGLELLGPQGFANRRELEAVAAAMVVEAETKGISIDRVAEGPDHKGYFIAEENAVDPGKRGYVERGDVRTMEQSSVQLRAQNEQRQQQQVEQQHLAEQKQAEQRQAHARRKEPDILGLG